MLITKNLSENLKRKFIFVDNDFLSFTFRNPKSFKKIVGFLAENRLTLDSLTYFEFLRDSFLPETKKERQNFLMEGLFEKDKNLKTQVDKRQNNALHLSHIYAHNGKCKGVSYVDYMLGSLLMHHHREGVLVTGNKKDFPSILFDTLGTLTFEDTKKHKPRIFWFLTFNKNKFYTCERNLSKVGGNFQLK
ncbi:hypothetical protein GF360_01245 [candidate division WWE3 bacterium]|nr:hypothetical protein [candidate division WWE3 bacterium]